VDSRKPLNECPVCKKMVESTVHCKFCNAHMEPELRYKNQPAPAPLPEEAKDFSMDELERIVLRLGDQDNLCTKDVAFHVQQRVRTYGIDPEYTENMAWIQDGEEIDPDLWERIDEAENNGESSIVVDEDERYALSEIEHVGYLDRWETVQVFFTSEGAQRYIASNKHNLTEPRIYGESFHRNLEMMTVRKMLPRLLNKIAAAEAKCRELENEVRDMDSACNTLLSSVCAERDAAESALAAERGKVDALEPYIKDMARQLTPAECEEEWHSERAEEYTGSDFEGAWETVVLKAREILKQAALAATKVPYA